ncbi:4Fe-4S binding protein [candidate division KSB1 bacterium]|nr:4Fe-4S binding protein [candidate division KSB1 bacterium]RQW04330.1 MAG: 4Fe-4S dicluster domain-containing protein [candidate division KSB1 bacterium]
MAHHTLKSSYTKLTERLNRFPQGAPPSEALEKILKIIIKEKEAELISQLPIKPFTAAKASEIWHVPLAEAQKVLDELAGRAILVDVERDGTSIYTLPPPMAGFFEFSMMRLRDDIDQKLLAELFYQYLNVEEDFIKQLFTDGETQLGRTFVHEPVLSNENALHVLDYERASEVIKTASHRAVGLCYCRHKMQHMNQACDAPLDICMTFNSSAESLAKHGHAREIDISECLDLLQQAYDHNLVQFGENVREKVNFICNCCGCCREAMLAAKRFAYLNPIHTTNFFPTIDVDKCTGCGACGEVCPVEAIALVSANDPLRPKRKIAWLEADLCLGCGICVRNCSKDALVLAERRERVITPLNSAHRAVVMALERGKLQNLIFDNRALWSHRALAAIFGIILKLPPIKQTLATQQVKSHYLESLIKKFAN